MTRQEGTEPAAPARLGLDQEPEDGLESAFARLLGRQPSREQCERLRRVRDVLGLRDNDALWSVLAALEHYDSLFRSYPQAFEAMTARALERARSAYAAIAQSTAAHTEKALAAKVAETSVVLAKRLADRPLSLNRWCLSLALVVVFGALCFQAGGVLAVQGPPFWLRTPMVRPVGWRDAAFDALSAPAGWMAFALLVPLCAQGICYGWNLASDPLAERREFAAGWGIIASCVVLGGLCAVALLRLR